MPDAHDDTGYVTMVVCVITHHSLQLLSRLRSMLGRRGRDAALLTAFGFSPLFLTPGPGAPGGCPPCRADFGGWTLRRHSTEAWAKDRPRTAGSKSSIVGYVKPNTAELTAEQDTTDIMMKAYVGCQCPFLSMIRFHFYMIIQSTVFLLHITGVILSRCGVRPPRRRV